MYFKQIWIVVGIYGLVCQASSEPRNKKQDLRDQPVFKSIEFDRLRDICGTRTRLKKLKKDSTKKFPTFHSTAKNRK